jgi:acyl dehydratase
MGQVPSTGRTHVTERIVQRGLYYEELRTGVVYEHRPGRTVGEGDITLSTLVGLSVGQLTQETTVANLGFGEIAFPKPVFHGDTLYAETEVVEMRPSKSRPDAGIVTFEHRARNQHGELVARARRSALMRRDPAGAEGGA